MRETVLLADFGRNEIADYVGALFTVYLILIFIRVLLSWIPRMPYNRYLRMFLDFVTDVTDPYLNMFRRVIPPLGMIDLSPILAIIVLLVVSSLLVNAIQG